MQHVNGVSRNSSYVLPIQYTLAGLLELTKLSFLISIPVNYSLKQQSRLMQLLLSVYLHPSLKGCQHHLTCLNQLEL